MHLVCKYIFEFICHRDISENHKIEWHHHITQAGQKQGNCVACVPRNSNKNTIETRIASLLDISTSLDVVHF